MKTTLTALLLFTLLFSGFCQNFTPYKNTHQNLKTDILFISSIGLGAIGDGLNDSNHKVGGHILNALSIGVLLSMPFILDVNKKKWWVYGLKYSFIRFGTFGPLYNKVRGLPINYVGTSSLDDRLYRWTNQQPMLFDRIFFTTMGFVIPID
jgi:hypothetical protein